MSPSAGLRSVDHLRITFLVDNCIEWFTKLPPGMTHELRQHLFDQSPPIDPVTGTAIIDLEHFCCGAHGFAALIETRIGDSEWQVTLFDTGPDSQSLVRNMKAMNVDAGRIERVVLSHWHSDHTGGLLSFLRYRGASGEACVVDVHPDRPIARGIAPPPNYDRVIGGLPADPAFEEVEELGGRVEMNVDGHAVADGMVWVSGEIPRETSFEGGILGGVRWVEEAGRAGGQWVKEEHIMDERYAAIDVDGTGLVILSACSHAGIVNVVKDAVKRFAKPVHMVIGGLHLGGPELAFRVQPTVDFLSQELRPPLAFILPMHCTGFRAKVALASAFGEGCVPAGVGIKVELNGTRGKDAPVPMKVTNTGSVSAAAADKIL